MTANPIRIGILGAGNVARIHAEAIRRVPGLELASVCSRSEASANRIAGQHGVRAFQSLDAFLSDAALQAVAICTPNGTHSDLGCRVARTGRHVLVEKPIDISLPKADALIEECDRRGVTLAVSFQSRFLDAPRALKQAAGAGRFGQAIIASAFVKWYRTAEYYASAPWRGTLALDGGGALINQAIHTIDLLRWIMGPAESIRAFKGKRVHQQIEGEDTLVGALQFQSGALGVVEVATSAYPGMKRRLEITGTEGTAILDGDNITVWSLRDGSPNPVPPAAEVSDGSANPMAIDCEGHRRVYDDFAQSILKRSRPWIDGIEGRQALELVLSIYEAAR